jgi:predicted nucleic acid-binding protein
MSVEFVDTNVLIYAHEHGSGRKYDRSLELLARLFERGEGALSIQVLAEFYAVATKKLRMENEEAEAVIINLRSWSIHRPSHEDLLRASNLHRRYKIAWWDAMIVNSAIELGCSILWTEDLSPNQRYETVMVRNPFK